MRGISQERIDKFDKDIEMMAIKLLKEPIMLQVLEDPIMRKEVVSDYKFLGLYNKLRSIFPNRVARQFTKKWREFVFKRDNFTCQVCHQKGGKLNAHHIKAFSKDVLARYDVDNGLTLCKTCHKLVHKSAFIWV